MKVVTIEYIVQMYSDKLGWYLDSVCGTDYENAKKVYFRKTIQIPNRKFRIRAIKAADCWWNDPFLAN